MTEGLNVGPSENAVKTGVREPAPVARALVLAEDQNDDVTAELAITRSAFHEKAARVSRAIAAA